MASKKEFLSQLWKENINACMQEQWIDNMIREAERSPNSPDVEMLHQSLLSADPSGKEGCPGSAPERYWSNFTG